MLGDQVNNVEGSGTSEGVFLDTFKFERTLSQTFLDVGGALLGPKTSVIKRVNKGRDSSEITTCGSRNSAQRLNLLG